MPQRLDRPLIYSATNEFLQALDDDGSIFGFSAPTWTTENLNETFRRVVEHPDLSKRDFEVKLLDQLNGASDDEIGLAAEAVFVWYLKDSQTSAADKRQRIEALLALRTQPFPLPKHIIDVLEFGLAHLGMAAFYKWQQFHYVLEFARHWKRESNSDGLRSDPWALRNFVMSIEVKGAQSQQHAFLHLVHPDTFEPAVNRQHKADMVEAFGAHVSTNHDDVDKALIEIREVLEGVYGSKFQFYSKDIRPLWDKKKQASKPPPAPTDTDSLGAIFARALAGLALPIKDRELLKETIHRQGPDRLREIIDHECVIRGRTGWGKLADVPWIALFPGQSQVESDEDDDTALANVSAQSGYYVVYLFAHDGSAVYLCLAHGVYGVSLNSVAKRTRDLRSAIGGNQDLIIDVDLASTTGTVRAYEQSAAYAIRYAADAVPDEDTLKTDVDRLFGLQEIARKRGLMFDSRGEPLHMLLKWSTDLANDTVVRHQSLADSKGSVWWGKYGGGNKGLSTKRIDQIRRQVSSGLPTYAFLYGGGEAWRTTIEDVANDLPETERDRLPDYYSADDCSFFVKMSDFEQLEPSWPLKNLVLLSDPDPQKMSGALGNQTTPLWVLELFRPHEGKVVGPPVVAELTKGWLVEQTLWPQRDLDEVIATLEGPSPQVVLAGPPGTGKTWVAKHVARYLTQDQPLAHRIVQFHASYGYEDFIEGLRPETVDGNLSFEPTPGTARRMVEEMADQDELRVLVMDEMNRANLPKVLGELMYLFEYRNESLDLRHTSDFRLPKQLAFLGTMNTADRSIRSLDIALRRRFEVFECWPDAEILARYYINAKNEVPGLIDGFLSLNAELIDRLDKHHTIGHTFFMANPMTPDRLHKTWKRKIGPLLEEYFFDQPDVAERFRCEEYWPNADA